MNTSGVVTQTSGAFVLAQKHRHDAHNTIKLRFMNCPLGMTCTRIRMLNFEHACVKTRRLADSFVRTIRVESGMQGHAFNLTLYNERESAKLR